MQALSLARAGTDASAPRANSVAGPVVPASTVELFTAADAAAIEAHLIALDVDDRLLRFGYGIADQGIAAYVRALDFSLDHLAGLRGNGGRILAFAHAGIREGEADFGLSVVAELRGCGLGQQLFAHVIEHCRLAGARRIVCHSISPAVIHMAGTRGFVRSAGKVDGPLVLELASAAPAC